MPKEIAPRLPIALHVSKKIGKLLRTVEKGTEPRARTIFLNWHPSHRRAVVYLRGQKKPAPLCASYVMAAGQPISRVADGLVAQIDIQMSV